MEQSARFAVERILSAFAAADVERFLETVSLDAVLICHGTLANPRGSYEGVEGARIFIKGRRMM